MAFTAIQYGLLRAVYDDIQTMVSNLTLTGVAAGSIKPRVVPTAMEFTSNPGSGQAAFPGIVISCGERETIEAATNKSDDIGYPILIAVFDDVTADVDQSGDDFLRWRQVIIDAFRHRNYTVNDPATSFHRVEVEPGPMIDWTFFQAKGLYLGSFVLRFFTRRQKT